jgi:hypothetical protein
MTLYIIITYLAPIAFGLLAACLLGYAFRTPRSRA